MLIKEGGYGIENTTFFSMDNFKETFRFYSLIQYNWIWINGRKEWNGMEEIGKIPVLAEQREKAAFNTFF